jgi:hypothetical protein
MITKYSINILVLLIILIFHGCKNSTEDIKNEQQDWTHYVRIAGHGLSLDRVDEIVKSATETHVFGIETDNSLTGYYESFLDPTEKLKAIAAITRKAHQAENYVFIYTEGLETITSNADEKKHTFFKDHPDWVQRDITDRPAVFGGGTAFWISEGDEDVWISPYAKEWRKMYMERIRQIAGTGIDGIFVDIPYWMTHFDGWENTWASFDDYTVAAFKEKTGLDAKSDLRLGDFDNPNFIKWVDFRIESLTQFMKDVDQNIKSVNSECKSIAEIYPGIEEAAVRVGADVYELYEVVDVIAHEYSGGGGNAASKNPLDWFSRMAGMYTFRAFAQGKPSWMLSYSWGREEKIKAGEAMKNLALSNVMSGTNCWDARGHVMSGSNDMETRKEIFKWIAENEKKFYLPRKPINPIGVYFSPKSRNYFGDEFINSYKGVLYLLLQSHLEFQIVTPRTISDFSGNILILPDVKCVSQEELNIIKSFIKGGKSLIVTGETGEFDATRKSYPENPIHTILKINDPAQKKIDSKDIRYIYYPECPGKLYMRECEENFNTYAWVGEFKNTKFNNFNNSFITELKKTFNYQAVVSIEASPFLSTQIVNVNDYTHIFMANFKGLKSKENAIQIPEENVKIIFSNHDNGSVYFLPFLGQISQIETQVQDNNIVADIPKIGKGGVIWIEWKKF